MHIEHIELPHSKDETTRERDIRWAEEERLNAIRADKYTDIFLAAHNQTSLIKKLFNFFFKR